MLKVLRSIIQEVNRAENIDQALAIIVARVKLELKADACSVYLYNKELEKLILSATDGLYPDAVGQVDLAFGEGIVGLVAQRAEPINVATAADHPSYSYFPSTGEERFNGFLGVPIIHHRNVLGVLVLQQVSASRYSEDVETLLITIAAQLTGAIATAEVSGGFAAGHDRRDGERKPLMGIAGAPGAAVGKAVIFATEGYSFNIVAERHITQDEVATEKRRYTRALKLVKADLDVMEANISNNILADERAIFDAYKMILDGESFRSGVHSQISKRLAAESALRNVVIGYVDSFKSMDDPYLRARAEDILDLGLRLLRKLLPEQSGKQTFPKNTILVAEMVTAAMLAEVPIRRLRGVVSMQGSGTSHTAILAKALNIPAVLGVDELPLSRVNGIEMVVDGNNGQVLLRPTAQIKREYRLQQQQIEQQSETYETVRDLPSETSDGFAIRLLLNTGLLADINTSRDSTAVGVGLYRTEYPFMVRDRFPGEEEQYRVYRKVLRGFHPLPVTMRTLDIGGDKSLPYFPIEEDNPFLGWRGIRFTLDHPEIFLGQLRAMLRANDGLGNLQILMPMICNLTEIDSTLKLLAQARREVQEELGIVEKPRIGVMVEVPSLIYQLPQVISRVDFLSVGSNDLTQYLLAVDRNNARVSELYDSLHPAVLLALKMVADCGQKAGKEVAICGEMAGDPTAAYLLLGLGFRTLSMNLSSLMRVKWMVRNSSISRCKEVASAALKVDNAAAVRELVAAAQAAES
ncbi:MAG: phosphoenolpyruvate--protein phosphotransferase [Gammaproteobacteria bacterium]|nr:phosphoenolpyruvate--protein phosphotransferase [Gammaproteobacteria bacterium]